MAEDLDHLLSVHHLLDEALGLGHRLLLAQEEFGGAAAHLPGHQEHGEHTQQQHQGHPHAEVQHDGKDHQHNGPGLDQGGDALAHQLTEGVDVVGVMAHDIAVLVGVKIADGQVLHTVEDLPAQLIQEALGHVGHQLGIGQHGDQGQQIQPRQQADIGHDLRLGSQPVPADIPFLDDGQYILDKQGGNGGHHGGEQNAQHGQRCQHRVIAEELLHHCAQRRKVCLGSAAACVCSAEAAMRAVFIHSPHLPCSAADRFPDRWGCAPSGSDGRPCPRCVRFP